MMLSIQPQLQSRKLPRFGAQTPASPEQLQSHDAFFKWTDGVIGASKAMNGYNEVAKAWVAMRKPTASVCSTLIFLATMLEYKGKQPQRIAANWVADQLSPLIPYALTVGFEEEKYRHATLEAMAQWGTDAHLPLIEQAWRSPLEGADPESTYTDEFQLSALNALYAVANRTHSPEAAAIITTLQPEIDQFLAQTPINDYVEFIELTQRIQTYQESP